MSRVDAAPRGLGAILDRALLALREHFGTLFMLALVTALPGALVRILGSDIDDLYETTSLVSMLLDFASYTIVAHFAARALSYSVVGQRCTRAQLLQISARELIGLLVLALVFAVIVLLGVLTIIGWILALWYLSSAPAVYALEPAEKGRSQVRYAISRSGQLAGGSFGAFASLSVVLGLLAAFAGGPELALQDPRVLERFVGLFGSLGVGFSDAKTVMGLLGLLPKVFVTCVAAFAYASLYVNQRARLEGVDLYIALEELERA